MSKRKRKKHKNNQKEIITKYNTKPEDETQALKKIEEISIEEGDWGAVEVEDEPEAEKVDVKAVDSDSKKHDKELDEDLHVIYVNESGEMPDLTHMDKHESSKFNSFLKKLIIILVIVSALGWGGFYLWNRGVFNDVQTLETEIDGPDNAKAGEEVFYSIRYRNTGTVPIASLDAKLHLPAHFEVKSFLPEPTNGDTWKIGSLSAGSDGEIIINGIFRSEVPSAENIQALFTYKPANFSSSFESFETMNVSIEETVFEINLDGPKKSLAGEEVSYLIDVQNTSQNDVENLQVKVELPDDFTLDKSEPEGESKAGGTIYWPIEKLERGEITSFVVDGSFTSQASGERKLMAEVLFISSINEPLVQTSGEVITDILGGEINVNLIVEGSTSDQTVELGETLLISINYENTGEDVISGLKLELSFDADDGLPLAFDQLEELVGATRTGDTFVWDESTDPEVPAELQPGELGVIDLAIPIFETLDTTDTDNFIIGLTASMEKIGSVESERVIESTPIAVAINSDLALDAFARYYDDDANIIGEGELPPRVGKTTKYQLMWKVENSLHDLKDVRVSTTLPQDVAWTDKQTAELGSVSYDDTTRTVVWTIEKMPTDVEALEATFEVAIVPEEEDVGSFFKLTNTTSIEATDQETEARLTRAINVITTELANDELASGKGVVVE